jgi:hypothetical protein
MARNQGRNQGWGQTDDLDDTTGDLGNTGDTNIGGDIGRKGGKTPGTGGTTDNTGTDRGWDVDDDMGNV